MIDLFHADAVIWYYSEDLWSVMSTVNDRIKCLRYIGAHILGSVSVQRRLIWIISLRHSEEYITSHTKKKNLRDMFVWYTTTSDILKVLSFSRLPFYSVCKIQKDRWIGSFHGCFEREGIPNSLMKIAQSSSRGKYSYCWKIRPSVCKFSSISSTFTATAVQTLF